MYGLRWAFKYEFSIYYINIAVSIELNDYTIFYVVLIDTRLSKQTT